MSSGKHAVGVAILLAALGGAGCGGSPQSDTAQDDSNPPPASVVEAGGDSDAAGNAVPVKVAVPSDAPADGTLVVVIQDVSVVDAESVELGRVEIPMTEFLGPDTAISVPVASEGDGNRSLNASAHLDVDSDGKVSEGDWLSTEMFPASTTSSEAVTVRIEQV